MPNPRDLIGQKFGHLTVSHKAESAGRKSRWICVCECGETTKPVQQSNLVTGNTTSCGCHRREVMNWAEDFTGKRFGYLEVIKLGATKDGHQTYICKCVCGREKAIKKKHLIAKDGAVKSCGCMSTAAITKHGHNRKGQTSPEYVVWGRMLARCTDENLAEFLNYGGRGITVCDRWLDFRLFLEDMGVRPSRDHSIERLNNNLGYFKRNCVWATRTQQARNKRTNRLVTFDDETLCLAEWCERFNLAYTTTLARLSVRGWSPERAFTTPTPSPYVPNSELRSRRKVTPAS